MADASKRINLAAPLLSVRRHGGAGADATVLQSCRPDATPGGVPFGWEHRPGHPKSVRTRRTTPAATVACEAARDSKAVVVAAAPVRAEVRLSDVLSRVDSCFTVNCSATGLSDVAPACAEPAGARGGVMMDRFLPAAHTMAVSSPCTFRKAGTAAGATATAQEPTRNGDGDVLPSWPPPQQSPTNHAPCIQTKNDRDDDDDDEWDSHSTRGFASRRCGLLPSRCMKSTMLLLNPALAMRPGGRRGRGRPLLSKGGRGQSATNPLERSTRNEQHIGHDPSMQSWEEVYIHSLLRSGRGGRKDHPGTMTQGEEGVHPKATHLGFLLVLDRDYHCSSAQSFPVSGEPKLPLRPQTSTAPAKVINGGKKLRRDAGGGDTQLLLEDKSLAKRDILPLLTSPSESWLSRALPSVSSNPPATSFLGIHVQQQHKKQAPSPWFSGDPTKAVDHARPRQMRIYDLVQLPQFWTWYSSLVLPTLLVLPVVARTALLVMCTWSS